LLTIDQTAYFERLAEVEEGHWWSLGLWRLATHWLDLALAGRRGLHALDIGCGAGGTIARLAARQEITTVLGLDPSPDALRLARTKIGPHILKASAVDLPFEDDQFDLVTCFDVFQHLPAGADRRAAAEACRVLRPGGVALFRTNHRGLGEPPTGVATYRLADLVALLNDAGLVVRRATRANCLPALAQELRGRFHRDRQAHPAGGGLRIALPSRPHNRIMLAVAAAEAAVAGRWRMRLPFGHSMMILGENGVSPRRTRRSQRQE
jgi:SAM-dependent methyltransferase